MLPRSSFSNKPSAKQVKRMEHRWGFLAPWCAELKGRIRFKRSEGRLPNVPQLIVSLPTRREPVAAETFKIKFRKVQEALALLAAVAHVDQVAWKYLLSSCCEVKLGNPGEANLEHEIPAQFVLTLDLTLRNDGETEEFDSDLVAFCGVQQHTNPNPEYLKAQAKIMDQVSNWRLRRVGMEVEIPVQVYYEATTAQPVQFVMANEPPELEEPSDEQVQQLVAVKTAEVLISGQWKRYRTAKHPTMPSLLQCTFLLTSMIVDVADFPLTPAFFEPLDELVASGVCFSEIMLSLELGRTFMTLPRQSKIAFGKFIRRLFGCIEPSLVPFNLDTLRVVGWEALRTFVFEAMCSAMVANRTTKKVAASLQTFERRDNRQYWEWLAYALFSKRSRAFSSLESVALVCISWMSDTDVARIAAIVQSDHPEELICGLPRGQVEEREATLAAGSPIRWPLVADSGPVTLNEPVSFVRTFSDDGASRWVNAMVPGFGRCQVQRDDLVFDDPVDDSGEFRGLSLKIAFDTSNSFNPDGLFIFIAAVGPTLKSLSIQEDCDVDWPEDFFLGSCPNLEELAITGFELDARLNFCSIREAGGTLPTLSRKDWRDISAISAILSDSDNPLAKCMRRLRVRLTFLSAYTNGRSEPDLPKIEAYLKALLGMLERNCELEYLEVVAPSEALSPYVREFQRHHLVPTYSRSKKIHLADDCKAAFLSVISTEAMGPKTYKAKYGTALHRSALEKFDPAVLSLIFDFATSTVPREVYCRLVNPNDWEAMRYETPI